MPNLTCEEVNRALAKRRGTPEPDLFEDEYLGEGRWSGWYWE